MGEGGVRVGVRMTMVRVYVDSVRMIVVGQW